MSTHAKSRGGTQSPQYSLDKVFESMLLSYQYAQGIEFFEKYFRTYPFLKLSSKNLAHLGLLYDHAAMTSEKRSVLNSRARYYYNAALKIDPEFYSAWWGLGRIFWHLKDKRALPYAKKAYRLIKKQKSDIVGQFAQNIALIYKDLGNKRRAEFWFKRGVEESPKEWGAHYNFMRFYLDTKPNEQEARKLAKKLKSMLETEDRSSRWLREVYVLAKRTAE